MEGLLVNYKQKERFCNSLWQKVWRLVWDMSEYMEIPLGRFAPWVFAQAIGCEYRRMS